MRNAKAILGEIISHGIFSSRLIYGHVQRTKLRERGNTRSLMGMVCCFVMQKQFVGRRHFDSPSLLHLCGGTTTTEIEKKNNNNNNNNNKVHIPFSISRANASGFSLFLHLGGSNVVLKDS